MPSTFECHLQNWLEAERKFEEAAHACVEAIAADTPAIHDALRELEARRRDAVEAMFAMTIAAAGR